MVRVTTPNQNPKLLPLTASVGGVAATLDRIPVGARVSFEAGWPADAAETFVVIDLASQALVTQRESLRVSWFATGGVFDADRTGRDESDPATTSDNGWASPAQPGTVHLWMVLRDSRGGIDFASYGLVVVQ